MLPYGPRHAASSSQEKATCAAARATAPPNRRRPWGQDEAPLPTPQAQGTSHRRSRIARRCRAGS